MKINGSQLETAIYEILGVPKPHTLTIDDNDNRMIKTSGKSSQSVLSKKRIKILKIEKIDMNDEKGEEE